MIPSFNEHGYLPEGVHRATLAEVAERFGTGSELRRVQMESVRWMVELSVRAGVQRIVLNGSFVTNIIEPNDVDCVLLAGSDYPKELKAAKDLVLGLPFLHFKVVDEIEFSFFAGHLFARGRNFTKKEMIELVL